MKTEVKKVVIGMKLFKALGPDGFQPFFFKQYWPIVGDDLWKMMCMAFQSGYVDPCLLQTLIVLIPKVDHPSRLMEFGPINLCNVAYMVIT